MHLLLAPSGYGKTAHILQRIRVLLAAEPLAPVYVVLPNQVQVQAFHRRLASEGGAAGVQVTTFHGLYAEVLAAAGRPVPRLFDPVQHRLLRAALDRLVEEGVIRHYKPLQDKPGFLRLLRSLVMELKRARVLPEELIAATLEDEPRLAELAHLYALYQEWLVATGWADAEGQGWLATLALEEDSSLLGADRMRLLVVDGFDEFNPTQLAVLKLLAQRAAETVVTLTGDWPLQHRRPAHRRFDRAREALVGQLDTPEANITLLDTAQPSLAGPLAHLEAGLFEPSQPKQPANGAIELLEAQDRAQEVRAALRWLKQLVVGEGMGVHELALMARDLEAYSPHLVEVAAEFGMPLQLMGGNDLAANPAVAALLNLLSLPVRNWPRQGVLDAWRSPYFDWRRLLGQADRAFDAGEMVAAQLAVVAQKHKIIEGFDQWREALDLLTREDSSSHRDSVADDDGLQPAVLPTGLQAQRLWQLLEAFANRLEAPSPATVQELVHYVEDLIGEDPDLASQFESAPAGDDRSLNLVAVARSQEDTKDRDVAALRAFKDVLRGLVLAEGITVAQPLGLRAGPIPYARFLAELRGAVEAASYEIPARGDKLAAIPVLGARGLSFRAVVLLGLSEGQFPQVEREDPLLPERDRLVLRARGLPLEPRLRGEEATLFYEAVTRARERLLLTRPYLADDGQNWEPSPFWTEVQRLVDTEVKPRRLQGQVAPHEAASFQELLAGLPLNSTLPSEALPEVLARDWQAIGHAVTVLSARLADRADGPFEGDLQALGSRLQQVYGPDYVWSSSKLEGYATCAFYFLAGTGLQLDLPLRPEAGFDVLILGSIYHQVLEKLYEQARDAGDWSQEALLSSLPRVAEVVFASAPTDYSFRPTPLWEVQKTELRQKLEQTLKGLVEIAGSYRPLALEQAFGLDEQPPLAVQTGEQDVPVLQLRGLIDRVDVEDGSNKRLRIVDYKTGSTLISVGDLDEGRRIQLPLYALAAQQALGLGEVVGGFYWHINAAKPSSLNLETYEGGVEAAMQVALAHAMRYVRGVQAGRFQPSPPAKGCPSSCPATGFCWRYQAGGFR